MNNIEHVQRQMKNWWEFGVQNNPLLFIQVLKDNHEPIPDTENLEEYWTDIDFIIKKAMKTIENTNYYGVALPYHYIDYSATAMACSLGGKMKFVNKETIWSYPIFNKLEDVMNAKISRKNIAYNTQMEITRRSVQLSKNHHFVSPWAFGGILDNISGLYETQDLMMDLLTKPELVKKVMGYFTDIWIEEFNKDIKLIETAGNYGHVCCWVGLWAPGSTFPIQEDLSYMISPDAFVKMCLPNIKRIVDTVEYPLYHLDGDKALVHLDAILDIENLKAIQWQPGAGKERLSRWYHVIRKIIKAGKSCQVFANVDEIDDLVENIGSRGLLIVVKNASNEQANELMEKYVKRV